jgi:Pentapeptide repeats (9 copies)
MLHVLSREMVSCEQSGKGIRNTCLSDPKEGIPMANPLHLELLSEGTETCNSWIHSHPYVVADLSEDYLEHFHLDNAHLISANFIGANLSQATFQGTSLSWVDLSDACLMGADLYGADLREAFLRGIWL